MAAKDGELAPASAKRSLKNVKLRPTGVFAGAETIDEIYKVMQWEVRPKSSRREASFFQKLPTQTEVLAALRPYAEAVGQANFEWNNLQQWLSSCFWFLFQPNGDEAIAVWDSINSDRVQRNLLIESAKVKFIARSHHPDITVNQLNLWYEIYDSIEFLVNSANKFEDFRNNAIHAPIKVNIAPDHFLVYADDQHIRGSALKRKMHLRNTDIMDELGHLRKSLRTLNSFAHQFWSAWVDGKTLPKIPRMPNLVPRKSRKQSRPTVAPK